MKTKLWGFWFWLHWYCFELNWFKLINQNFWISLSKKRTFEIEIMAMALLFYPCLYLSPVQMYGQNGKWPESSSSCNFLSVQESCGTHNSSVATGKISKKNFSFSCKLVYGTSLLTERTQENEFLFLYFTFPENIFPTLHSSQLTFNGLEKYYHPS